MSHSKAGQPDTESELAEVEKELQTVQAEIRKLNQQRDRLLQRKENLEQRRNQEVSDRLACLDWETNEFPWTSKLRQTLKEVFHLDGFRPKQLSAINASMKGHDTILIMPTGGGKSLCYQLPALISTGITLVVSPLVALMEDQLMALKKWNVEAAMLSATATREHTNYVFNAMTDTKTKLKLIYVTPEKLAKSKRFMTKLQKMYQMKQFARLAIDEVHCCSQWGHDFRPDYKFLGVMKSLFSGVPIMGLTATATTRVAADVKKILNLDNVLVFKASFNRPNLFYEVRAKPASQKEWLDELEQLLSETRFAGQSGIIYTTTVKDCDELAAELARRRLRVAAYHANLEPARRSSVHQKWLTNDLQAVVATIAFGMGIDKPDVRFVVHHSISKSMENFYQESGRAGRDDRKSWCIVYWRLADLFRLSTMVFTEQTGLLNLYSTAAYCLNVDQCRRQIIAGHFGERWDASACDGMCDRCSSGGEGRARRTVDVAPRLRLVLRVLQRAAQQETRLTAQKLLDAMLNRGQASLRVHDTDVAPISRDHCETVLAHLLLEGYLKEDFHFTPYNTISYLLPGRNPTRS